MQEIHQTQPVRTAGVALDDARAAMILVHGRGATADSILTLTQELDRPHFAYLAPQAAYNTWYPQSFLAPLEQNEPYLSSALATLDNLVQRVADEGIPHNHLILLGFSQGACLASEYVARNARRYGGLAALSGGLIGAPGASRDYDGSLQGTPVFLGCSDVDPHIPRERVDETEQVLSELQAEVTKRIYRGMGHTVNQDEIEFVRSMMDELLNQAANQA
ncbi:MAG TPA: dienelactone hydrolase family protein [Candidatus Sulfomarinibacteraceae bacterium]|nr:dienelactone hydrolase family protein [Candidatus Sulfomarinibacteraceae bacterium]